MAAIWIGVRFGAGLVDSVAYVSLPCRLLIPILSRFWAVRGTAGSTKVASVVPASGLKFTCLIDYRKWLVDFPWENARDLHAGMTEFRELRPDCNAVIFAPEYSSQSFCRDRDRVGGYRVGSFFSRGQSYNYNLELLSTRRGGSGDMLIHFARLPESTMPGCWYYTASQSVWYGTVVGVGGQAVASTPVVVPDPVVWLWVL